MRPRPRFLRSRRCGPAAKGVKRGGRRIFLTPEGKQLRGLCASFFEELGWARTAWQDEIRVEPLRPDAASGLGRYDLLSAVRAVWERYRRLGVRLELRFDSADVVLARLEVGESDAAFVYRRRISNRLRFLSGKPLLAPDDPDARF